MDKLCLLRGLDARKTVSGFAAAGAAMAQQLTTMISQSVSAIGRVVSKRFWLKRPSLSRWKLVIDYLLPQWAFERASSSGLYLDSATIDCDE